MDEEQNLARVADVGAEDGAMRHPLIGMFGEDLPVPASLGEAVEAVRDQLPNCANTVKIAERAGRKAHKKHQQVAPFLCACIAFYTLEATPREASSK